MKKTYLVRVGGIDGLIGQFEAEDHAEAMDKFSHDVEKIEVGDEVEVFTLENPTHYVKQLIYKKIEEKGKNGKAK